MMRPILGIISCEGFIVRRGIALLMVDINTAMAAAAAERRNRGSTGGKERKKNRSGADLGIESFDPQKHVRKEKADTASMWFVILFAIFIAIIMRYAVMPSSKENPDLLWFIPLMMIFLLPTLHRQVMPDSFVEHYTKGTWFKASFLHVFTWLAATFLLTNAPLGDIVAPQHDDWGVIYQDSEDSFYFVEPYKNEIFLEDGYDSQFWIVLSFTDNIDPSSSEYSFTWHIDDGNIEAANEWSNISEINSSALDSVRDHVEYDYPVAVPIPSNLSVGEYELEIVVTEDGSPWENKRVIKLDIEVLEKNTSPNDNTD